METPRSEPVRINPPIVRERTVSGGENRAPAFSGARNGGSAPRSDGGGNRSGGQGGGNRGGGSQGGGRR
jgi:hypothetical protein